jgi:hypothetical protein
MAMIMTVVLMGWFGGVRGKVSKKMFDREIDGE